MDGARIDALARSLSDPRSRRSALGAVLGGAVALIGGTLAPWRDADEVAAGRHKRRKRRNHRQRGTNTHHDQDPRKGQRKGKGKPTGTSTTHQPDPAREPALEPALEPAPGPAPDPVACGGACSGRTPICVGNVCTACSAANPCPGGLCCRADGQCVASCPTCQSCDGRAQCVADASQNGTACGMQNQPGGGVTRCCNGTCPDSPCLPYDQPCAEVTNCADVCCTEGATGICPGAECVCTGSSQGNACGSDTDCLTDQGRCVCGTCCTGPGGISRACLSNDPSECCSGVCATDDTCQ